MNNNNDNNNNNNNNECDCNPCLNINFNIFNQRVSMEEYKEERRADKGARYFVRTCSHCGGKVYLAVW